MIDPKRIDELARVLKEHGLTRLRLEENNETIELECDPAPVVVQSAVPAATTSFAAAPARDMADVAVAPASVTAPSQGADAVDSATEDEQEETLLGSDQKPLDLSQVALVTAPMVGVFYAAPSPGAEPFVHVGSKVHKGDTLCVIEAMKLMNEVVAERDGEIVDVCVEDGELVEFGCTLMKLY